MGDAVGLQETGPAQIPDARANRNFGAQEAARFGPAAPPPMFGQGRGQQPVQGGRIKLRCRALNWPYRPS